MTGYPCFWYSSLSIASFLTLMPAMYRSCSSAPWYFFSDYILPRKRSIFWPCRSAISTYPNTRFSFFFAFFYTALLFLPYADFIVFILELASVCCVWVFRIVEVSSPVTVSSLSVCMSSSSYPAAPSSSSQQSMMSCFIALPIKSTTLSPFLCASEINISLPFS